MSVFPKSKSRERCVAAVPFSELQGFRGQIPAMRTLPILVPLALLLGGCVVQRAAETAVSVVSIPVRAVGAGVDAVTTSQAEADQRRGREVREEEEQLGREARSRERERARRQAAGEPEDRSF